MNQSKIITLICFLLFILITNLSYSVPLDCKEIKFPYETAQMKQSSRAINAGSTSHILNELAIFQFGVTNGSDCWGWTAPDNQQYAIMGTELGLVFVNISTFQVIDTVPGSACLWQDIVTYQNYCYAVSECGTGLRVLDLQYLPDSVHLIGIFPTSNEGDMSSHNAAIDSTKGFLYVEGQGGAEAINIFDLAIPEFPVHISSFSGNSGEVHDLTVVNDTAYVAEGGSGRFSIIDVSDKFNPLELAVKFIPNSGYVHNIWPSDNRKYLVTTEETSGKTVKIWNIEDLNDIYLMSEYLGPNNLAHNAHYFNDFIYLSHYSSGVIVLDVSQPYCPKEAAVFDLTDDNCWGVFPFTQNNLIYASHLDGRLFVLQMTEDLTYVNTEPDDDNDGVDDICDNCIGLNNPGQLDSDHDGIGDECDSCPFDADNDNDGDGICGDIDNCQFYNPLQEDADNDGLADACDECPLDSLNDIDLDNVCANLDNCPEIGNEFQIDSDNDGIGDPCDECPGDVINDPDQDGLCGAIDNCPYVYNPSQTDIDGDGIGDSCDNCIDAINETQSDLDSDGVGDLCDNCVDVINPDQINSDTDIYGDSCDNCDLVDNLDQLDLNGDGIGDVCCCDMRGDMNNDVTLGISDLTFYVDYLFNSGPTPTCYVEGDINNDESHGISDLTFFVDFLFNSGPAPVACD